MVTAKELLEDFKPKITAKEYRKTLTKEEKKKLKIKKTTRPITNWSTADEIRYLNHIGTYAVHPPKFSRRQLLLIYEKTLERRENWGSINKEEIQGYLAKELRFCKVCGQEVART